jgi:hypothetical protein
MQTMDGKLGWDDTNLLKEIMTETEDINSAKFKHLLVHEQLNDLIWIYLSKIKNHTMEKI